MSPHEFTATINTFNTAAWHYPPPSRIGTGSLNYYLFCLSTIVLVAVITAIHYTHQIGLILVLPFSFLLFSLIVIYWRRRKMNRVNVTVYSKLLNTNFKSTFKQFESAMIHLCSCMNATENVRGINFRLTYLTPEQQISIHPSSSYASIPNSILIIKMWITSNISLNI